MPRVSSGGGLPPELGDDPEAITRLVAARLGRPGRPRAVEGGRSGPDRVPGGRVRP